MTGINRDDTLGLIDDFDGDCLFGFGVFAFADFGVTAFAQLIAQINDIFFDLLFALLFYHDL